ncbi:MAG: hypothetical protein LBH86_00990 [Oscillospiraceae bacterium]|jgi:hypothetical protein|nr:hypothetical protein [Oscillospiraceae bacterium]
MQTQTQKTRPGNILTKLTIVFIALTVILAVAACFLTLDLPPRFDYAVSVADAAAQTLRVKMTVSTPLFCRDEQTAVYLGDKNINILSVAGARGGAKELSLSEDGVAAVPIARGSRTTVTYEAQIGVPGKHGNRGALTDNYAVFDGDQILLLPVAFYMNDEDDVRDGIGRIGLRFDFPADWQALAPAKTVRNPRWIDVYNLSKNAFAFGRFATVYSGGGLRVYAPEGGGSDAAGFPELYAYYRELFGGAPEAFNVVLLPPDSPDGKIIGGAGTGTVAASFDRASLRDWQLLAHRMFHAFYDTFAPYPAVHTPPNLWLNEGLATYYENMAVAALPPDIKTAVGADTDRQFALLFDQFLYAKIRDPYTYGVAPVDEGGIESEAVIEFLHYYEAPLIVKAFEDLSQKRGNAPDALLRYVLDEDAFATIAPFQAAFDLLGAEADAFAGRYISGVEIPDLWYLEPHQPPSPEELLEALNYVELHLGSWQRTKVDTYPIFTVTRAELDAAMKRLDTGVEAFVDADTAIELAGYSHELYALLNDYYAKAASQNIAFSDENLRYKLKW